MAVKPNLKAFKQVCNDLKAGDELTFEHIGSVFGSEFWMMLVMTLMDSQDAARAIQGAIARLKTGEEAPDEEVLQ